MGKTIYFTYRFRGFYDFCRCSRNGILFFTDVLVVDLKLPPKCGVCGARPNTLLRNRLKRFNNKPVPGNKRWAKFHTHRLDAGKRGMTRNSV